MERQGLFYSLGVAIVSLPASHELALCILNKQERVSLGLIPAFPFPLSGLVTGSLPSWLSP